VSFGVHEPLVFRGELRVGFAGLIGSVEEGFAQQWVAGFGEPVVVFGLSGLVDLGHQPGVGADGGQGVEAVRVADAAGDDGAGDRSDAGRGGDDRGGSASP
jgi:hypothetical protein